MKIAIPTADGRLCTHFGHCREFALVSIDPEKKEIINTEMIPPPPHEPGVLPQWLRQMGCDLVIAGGMGQRAISMFNHYGIRLYTGAPSKTPREIVTDFMHDNLVTGENLCNGPDHMHGQGGCQSHGGGPE